MRDFILLVCFLAVAAFGFYLMKKLDGFLDKNRKAISKRKRKKTRQYVILSSLATEVYTFGEADECRRDRHSTHTKVCDSSADGDTDDCKIHPAEDTEKEVHTNGSKNKE